VREAVDRRIRHAIDQALVKAGPNGQDRGTGAESALAAYIDAGIQVEVERAVTAALGDRRQRAFRSDREFSQAMMLAAGLRSVDRTLTRRHTDTLRAEISLLAPSPLSELLLRQAYRAILDHETRGIGRIAGSTYNILGKLTVPALLCPPDGPVLEVGTLYGLFIPALVRQLNRSGIFHHVTVVDPFVGIQVQPGKTAFDDPTGVPVTAEVAMYNMTSCGLRPSDVRLIEGYSTDEAVRDQVSDRRYALAVIDGDHSEDGVLRDLFWVETICLPGAVVIMDDYGDPRWSGVERAVRRYLEAGGQLHMMGTVSTSAYLRLPDPSGSSSSNGDAQVDR
jgi:hypothetical protein